MKLSPELRAYRYYKKHVYYYSTRIIEDGEKADEIYKEIASKFGADYMKLRKIIGIAYERFIGRVCL